MKRPRGFDTIIPTLKHYTYPTLIVLEITNECNLECIMCPRNKMTRPIGVMQEHLYRKIVDDISVHSPNDTQLWLAFMGEPLLLKEKIIEHIQYAVGKGLTNVNLNTNLVSADKDLCFALIKTQLNRIIISLDSATEETYNKIRKGGNFNRVLENINYLLESKETLETKKPVIIIQYIVMDENEHEVEKFKEIFKNKKVVLKIREKLGWGLGIEAKNLTLTDKERDYPCPWSNRGFSVHVTGQVGQCDASWNGLYYFGDLNHQSIAEVWNGKLAQLREKHWNSDFNFEPCKDCKDWQCGRAEMIYFE
ncbi:MAG: radical SAM protein [Actinobacteria bacterium]|nr:radical SAM protein [Chloroflexota bacterium]MBE3128677.1 radical SAM protein [Actinomycetota bacterium]